MLSQSEVVSCLDAIASKEEATPKDLAIAMRTFVTTCHIPAIREQGKQAERLASIEKTLNDPDVGLVTLRIWLRRLFIWAATALASVIATAAWIVDRIFSG